MIVLLGTSRFWIKLIRVKGRTSLQYHRVRTELHISLQGINLIRPYTSHRMTRGTYIEIAWGRVSEADIERLEDDYGRV